MHLKKLVRYEVGEATDGEMLLTDLERNRTIQRRHRRRNRTLNSSSTLIGLVTQEIPFPDVDAIVAQYVVGRSGMEIEIG